ncbi:MAG: hypothetical protein DRJ67_11000 [Thermoprotei archaeon]|nr:MAG: hypothetical protein DRJ67_11000 [Thermoprotei archaeon]
MRRTGSGGSVTLERVRLNEVLIVRESVADIAFSPSPEFSSTFYAGPVFRLSVDDEAGAVYLRLRRGRVMRTIRTDAVVLVDLDEEGMPVGLELLPDEGEVVASFKRLAQLSRELSA